MDDKQIIELFRNNTVFIFAVILVTFTFNKLK